MFRQLIALAAASLFCASVSAGNDASPWEKIVQKGDAIRTVTPVFGQLVAFTLPKGFVPAFEDAKDGNYIQESVLAGENVNKWSQMITLTGGKGLVSNSDLTPARFAGMLADGFKRACPDSYSTLGPGSIKLSDPGFVAVVASCGVANAPHSESTLIIVMKGKSDYYTLQWSERGAPSQTPIKLDQAKWQDRLKKLAPIKLCPIIPGEKEPYPSCITNTPA